MLQYNKLRQCGHIIRKDKDNWAYGAIDYEMESRQQRDEGGI